MTWHHMIWHLATNHITSPHVTSQPTNVLHLSPQPTASKQVTTSPPWNGWRLVHSKTRFGHRSGWSPGAHSIGKFFLWLIVFFLWNFRPRLARLYLYRNIFYLRDYLTDYTTWEIVNWCTFFLNTFYMRDDLRDCELKKFWLFNALHLEETTTLRREEKKSAWYATLWERVERVWEVTLIASTHL